MRFYLSSSLFGFIYFPMPDRYIFNTSFFPVLLSDLFFTASCASRSISAARSLANCSSASWKGSTKTCAFCIIISSIGLSLLSTSIFSMAFSVSSPPTIFPKTVCLRSKCLHDRNVMKLESRIIWF